MSHGVRMEKQAGL